jgi:hypothetical protein
VTPGQESIRLRWVSSDWESSQLVKSHTEYLTFNLPSRVGFVNVTDRVAEIVEKSGVQEGLVLCNTCHN